MVLIKFVDFLNIQKYFITNYLLNFRTLGHESTSCMRSNVLKQWITIYLSPLSNSEIVDIVTEKYPRLKTVAEKMVSVLDVDFMSYSTSNRLPSVRDILKWCNRSQSYFETGSPETALKIFQDAVDIFCGFMEKGQSCDCCFKAAVSKIFTFIIQI